MPPGQLIAEEFEPSPYTWGNAIVDIGGADPPLEQKKEPTEENPIMPLGVGTPRGVTFTPLGEEITLRWEWLNRFDKETLQMANNMNYHADEEPRTIITDTYLDYLLLLTMLGTKNIYGVQVFDEGEEPSTCHLIAKLGNPPRLKHITCYLARVANHCANGCNFCSRTNSLDAGCMAYRRGKAIYALCFEAQDNVKPVKGVIIVAK